MSSEEGVGTAGRPHRPQQQQQQQQRQQAQQQHGFDAGLPPGASSTSRTSVAAERGAAPAGGTDSAAWSAPVPAGQAGQPGGLRSPLASRVTGGAEPSLPASPQHAPAGGGGGAKPTESHWDYSGPSPRFGHRCVSLGDCFLFVLFGRGLNRSYYGDVHRFDALRGEWRPVRLESAAPLQPRAHFTVCRHPRTGLFYVYGGLNLRGALDDLAVVDLRRRTWTDLSRLPGDRPPPLYCHCACVLGDTLYVFGGRQGPEDDEREEQLAMHGPRSHLRVRAGARAGKSPPGPLEMRRSDPGADAAAGAGLDPLAMYCLDLVAMKWSVLRPTGQMPKCDGHVACALDGRMFVFAQAMHVFDPATGSWSRPRPPRGAPGMAPGPRQHYSMVPVTDGLLLFGGSNASKIPMGGCWAFDVRTSTWRTVDASGDDEVAPPSARSQHACAVVGGSMWLFGGKDLDNAQQSVFDDLHEYRVVARGRVARGVWPEVLVKPGDALREFAGRLQQLELEAAQGAGTGAGAGPGGAPMSPRASDEMRLVEAEMAALDQEVRRSVRFYRWLVRRRDRRSRSLLVSLRDRVVLNVGGERFETSVRTLRGPPASVAGPDDREHMLSAMFSSEWRTQRPEYFVDRDGTHFRLVLNYLRDGRIAPPADSRDLLELLAEANYYQLQGLVRILQAELQRREAAHRGLAGSQ